MISTSIKVVAADQEPAVKPLSPSYTREKLVLSSGINTAVTAHMLYNCTVADCCRGTGPFPYHHRLQPFKERQLT